MRFLRRKRLAPLTQEDVLWLVALDLIPIGDRVKWVHSMKQRIDHVNKKRASYEG